MKYIRNTEQKQDKKWLHQSKAYDQLELFSLDRMDINHYQDGICCTDTKQSHDFHLNETHYHQLLELDLLD